jgi:hypothetical protein
MNDLIQSLPFPSPIAGITHTWMGESWMVDGETSVMMVMKISSKSPSRQGARTEFLVSNRDFWWQQCNKSLSRKNAEPPLLSGQRVYVGGRRGRGDGWGGHTTGGRGQAWATPPWLCAQATASFCLSFLLRGFSGKIGFLQYFLEFFLKVGFLHKNETPEQFCWKQR